MVVVGAVYVGKEGGEYRGPKNDRSIENPTPQHINLPDWVELECYQRSTLGLRVKVFVLVVVWDLLFWT